MTSYPAPTPDERLKEQTIRDAVRFYRQQDYGASKPASESIFGQWRPFAAGALAVLAVVAIVNLRGPAPGTAAMTNGDRIAMLNEMRQVFGNRLEGVVQYKGNIQPVVNSTGGAYTNAQPVVITLRQGGREISIVSFSGNTVTVDLDHGKMTLSPVVTGDGHVIVEGKDFIWSRDRMIGKPDFSIDAKTLGTSL
jgi:hypothetical protein